MFSQWGARANAWWNFVLFCLGRPTMLAPSLNKIAFLWQSNQPYKEKFPLPKEKHILIYLFSTSFFRVTAPIWKCSSNPPHEMCSPLSSPFLISNLRCHQHFGANVYAIFQWRGQATLSVPKNQSLYILNAPRSDLNQYISTGEGHSVVNLRNFFWFLSRWKVQHPPMQHKVRRQMWTWRTTNVEHSEEPLWPNSQPQWPLCCWVSCSRHLGTCEDYGYAPLHWPLWHCFLHLTSSDISLTFEACVHFSCNHSMSCGQQNLSLGPPAGWLQNNTFWIPFLIWLRTRGGEG